VETPFDDANWRLSVLTDGFEGLVIVVERQQIVETDVREQEQHEQGPLSRPEIHVQLNESGRIRGLRAD